MSETMELLPVNVNHMAIRVGHMWKEADDQPSCVGFLRRIFGLGPW